MIRLIYIIILIYFLAGGIGFYFINRHKEPQVAKKSYTKFISYFFIINILFFSIVINPIAFRYVGFVIIGGAIIELFRLFGYSGYQKKIFFALSVLAFFILALGFFIFSGFNKELILFSFLVLSIFDSFSQITGQLWGREKILPAISPEKTWGGLIGGTLIAVASALLLKSLYAGPTGESLLMAGGIVLFAFLGDLGASYFKRRYNAKDYSSLIPGHGGILDRFDSLIAGGAWVAMSVYFFNF